MNEFDYDYFEKGISKKISNYEGYSWDIHKSTDYSNRIIKKLRVKKHDKILDFGCAKGFLVKALYLRGFSNVLGCDISEYAIANSEKEIKEYCFHYETLNELKKIVIGVKYIFSFNVFEHVLEKDLSRILRVFYLQDSIKRIYIIVPLGNNGTYYNAKHQNDITHVICKDAAWWIDFFHKNSFSICHHSSDKDYGEFIIEKEN